MDLKNKMFPKFCLISRMYFERSGPITWTESKTTLRFKSAEQHTIYFMFKEIYILYGRNHGCGKHGLKMSFSLCRRITWTEKIIVGGRL